MATTFKNAKIAPSGTSGTLYTCPAGKTAHVTMLQASAKTQSYTITATFGDASDASSTNFLTSITVPFGAGLGMLTGVLVLEEGDSLSFTSSLSNEMVVVASISEVG